MTLDGGKKQFRIKAGQEDHVDPDQWKVVEDEEAHHMEPGQEGEQSYFGLGHSENHFAGENKGEKKFKCFLEE